jgi:hypothetical protein
MKIAKTNHRRLPLHLPLMLLPLLALLVFIACRPSPAPIEPPTNPNTGKILGFIEATLDGGGTTQATFARQPNVTAQAAVSDLQLSRDSFGSLDSAGKRFLWATFKVKNNTGRNLNNLSFYALYQNSKNIGGTAIKAASDFAGNAITSPFVLRSILPAHGMSNGSSGLAVNPVLADMQVFEEGEINALQSDVLMANSQDKLLSYGYVVRNAQGGRTLAVGDSGQVTIAVKLANFGTATPYRFAMTFVASEDSHSRYTRSDEETTQAAFDRAAGNEVLLVGLDDNPTNSNTFKRTPTFRTYIASANESQPADFFAETSNNLGEVKFYPSLLKPALPQINFSGTASWNGGNKQLDLSVISDNISSDRSYNNLKAVMQQLTMASQTRNAQISGANEQYFQLGALAAGQASSNPWQFAVPVGQDFRFDFNLVPTVSEQSSFELTSASPDSLASDTGGDLVITGKGFDTSTEFFMESSPLTVISVTATQATVRIPSGFPATTYGMMAVERGVQRVLYPAVYISPGRAAKRIDPRINARSFVDGYVRDFETNQPIAGATVGIPGLETSSDEQGYFLLRGLPNGRQALKISASGYVAVYRNAQVTSSSTVTLEYIALEHENTNSNTIGPDGGTYYASDQGQNGPFLVVPAGALDQNANISFTHLRDTAVMPELPDGAFYVGFGKFEPTGLHFKKPATLFLPLKDGVTYKAGQSIRTLYFDEAQKRWNPDITEGTIVELEGKQFLMYELTHFSYGGGGGPGGGGGGGDCQAPPPICNPDNPTPPLIPLPVTGCVKYSDGTPAASILTNWGVTGLDGNFSGTIEPSTTGGRTVLARVFANNADGQPLSPRSLVSDGHSPIVFAPCFIIGARQNMSVTGPLVTRNSPCGVSGYGVKPPLAMNSGQVSCLSTSKSKNGIAPQTIEACSTDGEAPEATMQANTLASFRWIINNFGRGRGDLSSVQYRAAGTFDFSQLDLCLIDAETLVATLTLQEPPRAGVSAALELSISNRDRTQTVEANGTVNIAAAASPEPTVQNVIPTVLPDDVPIPAGIDGMPYTVNIPEAKSSVQFFHKDDLITKGGQKFARVAIPISLTDEMGRVLDIDKDGFKDGKGHFWHDIPILDAGTPRLEPIAGFNLSDMVGAPAQTVQRGKIKAQVEVMPCEELDIVIHQALASVVWPAKIAIETLNDFFKPSPGEPPATPGFFTLENIARVVVGAVPILGGAIDCGEQYYNLFAGRDVDLVTAMFGCLGMALDAGTFAVASLAGGVVTSGLERGFLLTIKAINGISKGSKSFFSTQLNKLFYKYFVDRSIDISAFKEELLELYDGFASFLRREGAKAIHSADELLDTLSRLPCSIFGESLVNPQSDVCNPKNIMKFVKKMGERAGDISRVTGEAMVDDLYKSLNAMFNINPDLAESARNFIERSTKLFNENPPNQGWISVVKEGYSSAKTAIFSAKNKLKPLVFRREIREGSTLITDADLISKVEGASPSFPHGKEYIVDDIKTKLSQDETGEQLRIFAEKIHLFENELGVGAGKVGGRFISWDFDPNDPLAYINNLHGKGVTRSVCEVAEAAGIWIFGGHVNPANGNPSLFRINCSQIAS